MRVSLGLVLVILVASCGHAAPTPDTTATQVPQAHVVVTSTRPSQANTATSSPTRTHTPTQAATQPPTSSPEPTETATPTTTPTPQPLRVAAQVLNVEDVKTIEALLESQRLDVVYWGIVGPEYHESLQDEARAANQEMVEGETVYIEVEERIPAGATRRLGYVFLSDGTFVNRELVRLGYAVSCCPWPQFCRYESLLLRAQQEAIDSRGGLWSSYSAASLEAPCLELEVPSTTLEIGQILPITMTLSNPRTSCINMGVEFSLDVEPAILLSIHPEPRGPSGVSPGQTHQVQFLLQAIQTGEAAITGRANYETHDALLGVGSWGACGSESIGITIAQGEGRILFRSGNPSQPGLWVMDADGGGRTHLPLTSMSYVHALRERERYSPEGQYNLFPGAADDAIQIFIELPSDPVLGDLPPQQVTFLNGMSYDPVWSPGGERIAFVSTENFGDDIWVVNADGSGAKWLTNNTWEWDKHPSWSPDGNQIVFWSNRSGLKQIYVMAADGSNVCNISNTEWDEYDPIWLK